VQIHPDGGERLRARAWSALAAGGRKPTVGIIGRDSPGRRRPAFRQQARGSCKVLRIFSAIVRMISTMAPRNAAIFAAHCAMMPSSAALRQGVLVM
jgi:hypothetical protein